MLSASRAIHKVSVLICFIKVDNEFTQSASLKDHWCGYTFGARVDLLPSAQTIGMKRTRILTAREIEQKLRRIAHQINEDHYKDKTLFLVGVRPQGYRVAERLAQELRAISNAEIALHSISLNKDKPWTEGMDFDGDFKAMKNKVIILVDDVLNSGETMIYGLKHFLNASLKKINTVVLVDRNHNRFPIKADYVGKRLSTSILEHVRVDFGAEPPYAVIS